MTSFMKLGPPRLHAQDVFAILFSSILFSLGPRADTPFRARRTMVSQLFKHERIETTVAKQVRRIADNMVQLGKGTLHAACRAAAFVCGDDILHKLFTELAYRYKD
ncbi:50S ribosomal protein [Musa troglodytarum]|uniref:50S ribosomal protein n=1 Tax=Musa troglodytarum TaxID=320322 RepID=A0A9E7GKG0_9LILI|nr:50S ribosomal protein [Musa troglodytarum]